MTSIESIFKQWEDDLVTGQEAVELLVGQLAVVEDSLVPLEQTRQAIRAKLSLIVDRRNRARPRTTGLRQTCHPVGLYHEILR